MRKLDMINYYMTSKCTSIFKIDCLPKEYLTCALVEFCPDGQKPKRLRMFGQFSDFASARDLPETSMARVAAIKASRSPSRTPFVSEVS